MTDQSQQYQQLIAKCWADEAFKQRLLADPAATLKAEGIVVPEGVRVQVVENTALMFNLVIPARPTDLSDEMLAVVAGGKGGFTYKPAKPDFIDDNKEDPMFCGSGF